MGWWLWRSGSVADRYGTWMARGVRLFLGVAVAIMGVYVVLSILSSKEHGPSCSRNPVSAKDNFHETLELLYCDICTHPAGCDYTSLCEENREKWACQKKNCKSTVDWHAGQNTYFTVFEHCATYNDIADGATGLSLLWPLVSYSLSIFLMCTSIVLPELWAFIVAGSFKSISDQWSASSSGYVRLPNYTTETARLENGWSVLGKRDEDGSSRSRWCFLFRALPTNPLADQAVVFFVVGLLYTGFLHDSMTLFWFCVPAFLSSFLSTVGARCLSQPGKLVQSSFFVISQILSCFSAIAASCIWFPLVLSFHSPLSSDCSLLLYIGSSFLLVSVLTLFYLDFYTDVEKDCHTVSTSTFVMRVKRYNSENSCNLPRWLFICHCVKVICQWTALLTISRALSIQLSSRLFQHFTHHYENW